MNQTEEAVRESPAVASASPAVDDPRVTGALKEYLASLEAGRKPDRAAFLARHPDIAAVLAGCLDGLEFLNTAAPRLCPPAAEPLCSDADIEPDVPLGDFRIVREVGRGGMGVVYEARQLSLGRRVALKVLPFAAALDPKHLQRFKNEAQAAAQLHHTNIVPVYGVGTERGVHFYAMQYIEGRTLAAVIAELRQGGADDWAGKVLEQTSPYVPAASTAPHAGRSTERSVRGPAFYRTGAHLGVQAAEALEHAHQLGVIHRDIKPANLLVDRSGNLWVTDFGLAHCQNQAGLTLTGDLVGTLRYMSPEQALAKRVVVDHRTDIYSLGATLYELLTLEPAFAGTDRQELLRQLAFEEPKTPRRIDRAIPAELETIVLKALEKNPAERYATAQELADDLEHWLKDEPIRARRPTVVQRLRRWSRRHRPVVAGLAAGLLTLLVVGVVLALGYQRWLAETDRAVTAALAQAETLLGEGGKQTDHPERWQATARLARAALQKGEELLATGAGTKPLARRVEQVRVAVEAAVADSGLRVELDRIRLERTAVKEGRFDNPRAAPLYAKAFAIYGVDLAAPEAAAARLSGSPLREVLMAALEDWAWATDDEQDRQRLVQVLRAAEPELNAFRAPWRAAVQRRDGAALIRLANEPEVQALPAADVARLGRDLAAVNEPAAAERLLRAGQEHYPSDFWLNHDLGVLLYLQQQPRAEEAVRYLTAALALRGDSPGVHLHLGRALLAKGDVEGAIRRYQAALQISPREAKVHNNLGVALAAKGRLDEAIAKYHEAIRLNNDYPEAHSNLGIALKEKGRLEEAIAEYHEAIRLDKDFVEAHNNLGNALYDKGEWAAAIAEYHEAIRLKKDYPLAHNGLAGALYDKGQLDEAIAEYHEAIHLKKDYPLAHNGLGNALYDKGQLEEAIAEFREALRLEKDAPEAHSGLGLALYDKGQLDEAIAECQEAIRLNKDLHQAHNNLGLALVAKGRLDEAIAEYHEAIRLNKGFLKAHNNLGIALAAKGQLDEAIAEFHEAIRLKKDFPDGHYNLGVALLQKRQLGEAIAEYEEAIRLNKDFPEAHNGRGSALHAKGQWDEAIAEYREAIRLKKDFPDAHNNLGFAQAAKGQLEEAIAAYQEAIRLKKNHLRAHYNLANAWFNKGQLEEAIAEYREVIRLKKDYPQAHYNLGVALVNKGRLEEAIATYREAIRLKKDYTEAYYNLGGALMRQGQFQQAVKELRLGHQLGSGNSRWTEQLAERLRYTERLIELDAMLPQVLKGEVAPADADERALLGWLCRQPYKQLDSAAARFYAEAFAAEPKLAEDLLAQHRYHAACAAILAGCGQGKDTDKLDDRERAGLRQQGLTWLWADLAAWRKQLENDETMSRPSVQLRLQHWLANSDFAGVRDLEALAKLPEKECQDWLKLWADVADLFAKAGGRSSRQEK